jgi:hypothetical protein
MDKTIKKVDKRRLVMIPATSYKRLIYIKARIEQIKGEQVPLGKVIAFLIEEHKCRVPQDGELPLFEDSVYAGFF